MSTFDPKYENWKELVGRVGVGKKPSRLFAYPKFDIE